MIHLCILTLIDTFPILDTSRYPSRSRATYYYFFLTDTYDHEHALHLGASMDLFYLIWVSSGPGFWCFTIQAFTGRVPVWIFLDHLQGTITHYDFNIHVQLNLSSIHLGLRMVNECGLILLSTKRFPHSFFMTKFENKKKTGLSLAHCRPFIYSHGCGKHASFHYLGNGFFYYSIPDTMLLLLSPVQHAWTTCSLYATHE